MEICDKRTCKTSLFFELNQGDIFEYKDELFMKLEKNLNYNGYNAVNLEYGDLSEFDEHTVINYDFDAFLVLEN